jgi:DNA-binding response OmpR family regulator
MDRVLLVDDSPEVYVLVRAALSGNAIDFQFAASVNSAKAHILESSFTLFIFDLHLPDGDSHVLISFVRSLLQYRDVPILILSSSSEPECKVSALNLGADDYLCKPFNILEFRARVNRMLTRARSAREGETLIGPHGLRLDPSKNMVYSPLHSEGISLSNTEFRLLSTMVRRSGAHFARGQLLDLVWGHNIAVNDRTIDTHIYTIRKKLGPLGGLIRSIPGVGYCVDENLKTEQQVVIKET